MDLAFWTNVAVAFLALHIVVLLLLTAVIVYLGVRGTDYLQGKTPELLRRLQLINRSVREQTVAVSQKVGDPLVRVSRTVARAEGVSKALLSRGSRPQDAAPSGTYTQGEKP